METEEPVIGIKKSELEGLVDMLSDALPPTISYQPNYIDMLQETIRVCQEVISAVQVNLLNRYSLNCVFTNGALSTEMETAESNKRKQNEKKI